MLRIVSLFVIAALLAGCRVVFIPIPVDGLTVPTTLPTPVPEQPTDVALPTATPVPTVAAVPADVALFLERYDAIGTTFDAMAAHMESMAFGDPEWCAETARLAREWHDAIDTLSGTTRPEGERWIKPWNMIQQAMQVYGYAAGSTETAGTECNPQHLETVRSELVRGSTLLGDAMRLLGEE